MQVMDVPTSSNWHLLAFNITTAAAAGYQTVTPVADPVFSRSAGLTAYQNPYNLGCFAAYVMSTSLIRARLNTPSLRLRGFPQIRPVVAGVVVPTDANALIAVERPIYLRPDEDIQVDVDVGANAEIATAFLWVNASNQTSPPLNRNVNLADLRWVRATATITTLLNIWTGPQAIALEDTLEGGSYDVYGSQCFGTTCIAHRLWFQNQYWKPGMLGGATVGISPPKLLDGPNLGRWGNFNTYSLPQLDIFASSAAAIAFTLFMLVAKSSAVFRGQQL